MARLIPRLFRGSCWSNPRLSKLLVAYMTSPRLDRVGEWLIAHEEIFSKDFVLGDWKEMRLSGTNPQIIGGSGQGLSGPASFGRTGFHAPGESPEIGP